MTKAIRIHKNGGPEVLTWEEVDVPAPGPDDIRLRHTAIGLNFIDIYHRDGLYPLPMPAILGTEGAGLVEAVGSNVKDLKIGQPVAYAGGQIGSYTEARIIRADAVEPLPDGIDDKTAAAIMLKGMTAYMLLHTVHAVKTGESVLVHAAAGGVGTILTQWAKHLGCTVIGTAGGAAKLTYAKAHGCDHVIDYKTENFTKRVKEITGGKGVSVIYDGIGKDTFMGGLDCLEPFGHMVTYGNASGPVDPISPLLLTQKGSLTLSRPSLITFATLPVLRRAAAKALFEAVAKGAVKIEIGQTYALKDVARAQSDLASRKTTGSTVLIP